MLKLMIKYNDIHVEIMLFVRINTEKRDIMIINYSRWEICLCNTALRREIMGLITIKSGKFGKKFIQ